MDARGKDSRRQNDGGGKRDYSSTGDSKSTGPGRKEIEKEILKFPTASKNETPFRNYPASRARRSNDEIDNSSREVVYLYEYRMTALAEAFYCTFRSVQRPLTTARSYRDIPTLPEPKKSGTS